MFGILHFLLMNSRQLLTFLLYPDISRAKDDDDARRLFDSLFEERINPLNSLDVIRRLVRELCVRGLRGEKMEGVESTCSHQDPVTRSETENMPGEYDRGSDFPSNDRSFVSMQEGLSPSPNPVRQSMLGTVRMPTIVDYEEDDAPSFNNDDLYNSSGSDIPSEDTSDDGSDDEDDTIDVSEGWKKVTGGADQPSHLDLFQTLANGGVSSRSNLPVNSNREGAGEDRKSTIRMPLKHDTSLPPNLKSSPNIVTKTSPPTTRSTRMSSKNNASLSKPPRNNYLLGFFERLPAEAWGVPHSPGPVEKAKLFTQGACDFISKSVVDYLGLLSDPQVEAEVIRPTLMMFINTTLDKQTIMVMEEMINSSLKAYEASIDHQFTSAHTAEAKTVNSYILYMHL